MSKSSVLLRFTSARVAALLSLLAAVVLLAASAASVSAQQKDKKVAGPVEPAASVTIPGTPLNITIDEYTRMDIRYTDPGLGLNLTRQFYGGNAEGVYIWAMIGGTQTVFGPPTVPAGNPANPYTPVSNLLSGTGTSADPWVVTTVGDLPGTNLRLTQRASYVNGAEFVALTFNLAQMGCSGPVPATVFHAADLYTGGGDSGYGFYDPATGGVGSYYTITTSTGQQRTFYQQFIPSTPASHYQEANYGIIWDNIGSTTGPGTGFADTINPLFHDAGAGLQWNLSIPAGGSMTVGDIDLFSVHASLCGSFSDVRYGDYYYEYIYYLACNGIVGGYNDTTFRPGNNVTRGQLAKIVSNSAGFAEPPTGQTFQDIAPGSTYYPFVQRMVSRGIMGGYACGSVGEPCIPPGNMPYFRPNANATRGQISKIVSNAAGYSEPVTGQLFEDVPTTHPFYEWIQRLASRGHMNGYLCGSAGEPCYPPGNRPYFRPSNNATRGQVSKIDANTFFPGCCPAR